MRERQGELSAGTHEELREVGGKEVLTKNCVKLVVKRDSRRVMIPFKRSMKK